MVLRLADLMLFLLLADHVVLLIFSHRVHLRFRCLTFLSLIYVSLPK